MVTAHHQRLCRARRWSAAHAAAVALAGLVLAGCSSLDPTGLLAEEDSAEPQQVDAGQADDGEGRYPELADVPDAPERRPASRQERRALEESLAADRKNARYSDEDLRSPEAAPDQPDVGADRGTARSRGETAAATGGDTARSGTSDTAGDMADTGEQMAETGADTGQQMAESGAETGGQAADTGSASGQASARDAAEDAMPEMPEAPSDSGRSRAAESEQPSGTGGGARQGRESETRESETQRMGSAERTGQGQASGQQGEASQPRGQRTQTARTTSADQQASGGGQTGANREESRQTPSTSDGGAVQVNRSQIPQMQPSRDGEPVQLPGQVRQRVGDAAGSAQRGAATGGQQTARLQSPPSSADEVTPGEADAGEGTRVAVIYFPHGTASLDGEDRQVLRQVADLYEKRDAGLRVVGHASSRTATMGMIKHRMVNLDTSMRRAETVADTLVRLGVPRGEIKVEARADRDPAYHEFMPTGEAGNRRAEIFLGG